MKSYGQITIVKGEHGELILPLPRSICRNFGLRIGDTITMQKRKAEGFLLRFYRHATSGWVRLLPGRKIRSVAHPR